MIAAGVTFVVAVALFIVIERRSAHPILPLTLFSSAAFSAGNAIGLLINLGFYGELFVLNLYLQQERGYSALLAGFALLPQMGVVALGSALSGRFTARVGSPRPTLLIGLFVGGAGFMSLLVAGAHTSYVLLVVPLIAAGFGMAFTMPAATIAVVDGVPASRAGLASGAINTARQSGGVIGIAVLGALVTSHGSQFIHGLHLAVVTAGGAFWLGGVIALVAVRRHAAPPRPI